LLGNYSSLAIVMEKNAVLISANIDTK